MTDGNKMIIKLLKEIIQRADELDKRLDIIEIITEQNSKQLDMVLDQNGSILTGVFDNNFEEDFADFMAFILSGLDGGMDDTIFD